MMKESLFQRLCSCIENSVVENYKNDVYLVALDDELSTRLERFPPCLIYCITEDAGGDERKPYDL